MLDEPVPLQIRNAPTKLMDDLGYGAGYVYAHDTKEKVSAMQCLPDSLKNKHYYNPTEQGVEKRVKERKDQLEAWKNWKRKQDAAAKK
jgi:putative ATPase